MQLDLRRTEQYLANFLAVKNRSRLVANYSYCAEICLKVVLD